MVTLIRLADSPGDSTPVIFLSWLSSGDLLNYEVLAVVYQVSSDVFKAKPERKKYRKFKN